MQNVAQKVSVYSQLQFKWNIYDNYRNKSLDKSLKHAPDNATSV